ncbi:MAG: excinuclease ABC subunit UvrC [Erysipelotrichaceae bacterium]|nr:excinuclease ABC subunit UvrC [Erysipelotrichaceae bacterium]
MLKDKLLTLPMSPGCYLMKNSRGEVIYVGKAKKLKNRVSQYFTGTHDNKTTKMVSNVADFDYIVASSEKEAFILEYNLIKQYRPRFNIIFMDDASYPYIRLTVEEYPTLKVVRDARRLKNAVYFGPYPNAGYARELVDLIHELYPLRRCRTMGSKVCLYYHLGKCLGPCEFDIDPAVYKEMADSITRFIKGDTSEMVDKLTRERDAYAMDLKYEEAGRCQNLLKAIEHVTSGNQVENEKDRRDEDFFAWYADKGFISIVGLLFRGGKLLHRHLFLKPLYEEPQEAFESYLMQYYNRNPEPKILFVPKAMDITSLSEVLSCRIQQPQRGQKRKQMALAEENARINLEQKFEIASKQESDIEEVMEQLAELTGCDTHRIELYDNSHISGEYAVGAMVVYLDGKPSRRDYRLYRVHNRNNDYANMQEVLYRRFFRALKEHTVMPDIIIMDGGASQINAANEILSRLRLNSIRVFGLVKNDKHRTASLMNSDLELLEIDHDSRLFFQLTQMQDEVHRFAISFHKKVRSKEMTHSQLDDIPGIGPKRKKALLRHFGTLKRIEEASVEELSEIVGNKQAVIIHDYFTQHENVL